MVREIECNEVVALLEYYHQLNIIIKECASGEGSRKVCKHEEKLFHFMIYVENIVKWKFFKFFFSPPFRQKKQSWKWVKGRNYMQKNKSRHFFARSQTSRNVRIRSRFQFHHHFCSPHKSSNGVVVDRRKKERSNLIFPLFLSRKGYKWVRVYKQLMEW